MGEFNAGGQVVALVTALRGGMDVGEVIRMTHDAVQEGVTSEREAIARLAEVVGMFAVTTAFICQEWDRADGTGVATRYMAALGQTAADHG
jgi:hypothetical protein